MADWSDIVTCPECGAGNPHDGRKCVKCGISLQEARAKDEAAREERLEKLEECPRVGRPNNKPVDELTVEDLKRHPVWEYDLENEGKEGRDETWIKPVRKLPVEDLDNRVVGTEARLADGKPVFCLFGDVDLQDSQYSQEFIQVRVFKNNEESFFLARQGDIDFDDHNPKALAKFLGLRVKDVFPITYDISAVAIGQDAVVKGSIPKP
jgi:ribosomal protein L40E